MKRYTKIVSVSLVLCLLLSTYIPTHVIKAQEKKINDEFEVITPFDIDEFDLANTLEKMVDEIREETGEDLTAEVFDGSKVLINSVNENGDSTEIIIDTSTSETSIDGEDIGTLIETEITIDQDKLEGFSIQASSDWTPVYQYTTTNTVKKLAGDLSKGAVYLAAILAVVASISTGAGLTGAALLTSAKNFISSLKFSVATTLIGDIIDGKWSYDTYRTKNLIKPPTSSSTLKQYAYRYQNAKFAAKFKIGNFTSKTWTAKGKTGAWWYASRPY